MIKIDFQIDTKYGKYSDALHLPENHTYTQEQILAMQTERVNTWINVIESPEPYPEYDEEDSEV
jgi:hypothetical protein